MRLTFRLQLAKKPGQSDAEAVMEFVEAQGQITIKDVRLLLQTSRNTATRRLRELVEAGMLERLGRGPAVRYVRKT